MFALQATPLQQPVEKHGTKGFVWHFLWQIFYIFAFWCGILNLCKELGKPCDIFILTSQLRPGLHEGLGLIAMGPRSIFWPNNWTEQSHKLYYFHEFYLSHVNLFDPRIGPKSYLMSFFLSSSFFFTLPMQEFQLVFSSLLSHFLTFFFFLCSLFLNIFILNHTF